MINSPRWMVARPRAAPIPLPRIALGPTRLNLSQCQSHHLIWMDGREVELTLVRWQEGLEQ